MLSVTSLLFTVLDISSVSLSKEQQVVAFLCSSITKCVVKIFCKLIFFFVGKSEVGNKKGLVTVSISSCLCI